MRWIRHLAASASVRRLFPQATLDAIHHAIAAGEKQQPERILSSTASPAGNFASTLNRDREPRATW